MVEIPVVEVGGWVAKIYRCRHVTERMKGSLTLALPQPGPRIRLARLARRGRGDEGEGLGGCLSDAVSAQGLSLCKAKGGSAVRERAHWIDDAVDHNAAVFHISSTLHSQDQGLGQARL